MPFIIIGPGIFFQVEVCRLPKTGDVLNLGNKVVAPGKYRITEDIPPSRFSEYPYFKRQFVGVIPEGEEPLPMDMLNV